MKEKFNKLKLDTNMDSEEYFIDINDFTVEQDNPEGWEYSRIFILKEKTTDVKYVAKELNAETYSTPKYQKLFNRYLITLSQLRHPSISRYRGFSYISLRDQKKWQPTILTEFEENRSLQEKLDEVRRGINHQEWTPTKKFIDLIGIVSALKFLHENKILHGNLKPGNILLDKNFYPKVCDFLHCQKLNDTKLNAYLAPEVLQGEIGGNASDVFSFGIIAYELFTGSVPYPDISEFNMKVMNQIIEGSLRPKFPSNFSAHLKSLIERCWDSDYLKRPSFDEIFSKLTQNVSDFQKEVDENELNNYLQILNGDNSTTVSEKPHNDGDDLRKIFHFYLSNEGVKNYFYFGLSEAFSSGNAEIVNILLSLKLVDINSVYVFIHIYFINEISNKFFSYHFSFSIFLSNFIQYFFV